MKSSRHSLKLLSAASIVPLLCLAATPSWAQSTALVSASSGGVPSNGFSEEATISPDGGFVVFHSRATNLVPNDTNGLDDDFIRDRVSGTTERVSIASDGTEANGVSAEPRVSDGGRFIVFNSAATNLVAGDTNGNMDIFLRDRLASTTERVSLATGGAQANGYSGQADISADGRFVYFISDSSNLAVGDTNGAFDVFVRDRTTGITNRVSVSTTGVQGNGTSRGYSISDDGRFASFRSEASNLISGDGNGVSDAFVHDNVTGVTERVSVANDGSQANGYSGAGSISADGRYVAFSSLASNLVPGDTNGNWDCFVRDRSSGTTTRASVSSNGDQSDGSFNYCDAISGNGQTLAFNSDAANLASGAATHVAQAYVRNILTNKTYLISIAPDGQTANSSSGGGSSSADGRFISFGSNGSNLYANDANNNTDIFVRDRGAQNTVSFIGFNSPLENLPFSNSAKAGSAIPVKWRLTDQNGAFIGDLSVVQSLQFAPVACDSQDIDFENPITALASGGSGLQYNATTHEFTYPWKTDKSMAKTCAVFALTLTDGQQQFARFMLK